MQTERTLSRSTLTVQDMTVDSTKWPTLPSITTPRCDLRPYPGTALQPTKRRERFSCTFGQVLLTPYGALLDQVSQYRQYVHVEISSDGDMKKERFSSPWLEARGLQAI